MSPCQARLLDVSSGSRAGRNVTGEVSVDGMWETCSVLCLLLPPYCTKSAALLLI